MLALNLALAFALELAALFAFGLWGYRLGDDQLLRIVLATALTLTVALLWGVFLSPKASIPLGSTLTYLLRFGVFALAATAYVASGRPTTAAVFGVLVVLNLVALHFLRQPAA